MRKLKGVPFMKSSFTIRRSPYLHEFKFGDMNSAINKHGGGHALRMNTKAVIKATLGEHLERTAATKTTLKYLNKNNQPIMESFNLLSGQVIKIPAEKIFINFDLPMFNYKENIHELFNDSCGLAAHVDSEQAIVGGFKEFIERQSLVYNWLSKSEGQYIDVNKIDLDKLSNPEILKLAKIASDKFYCFNISIVDGVYVVFTFGFKGEAFSSGIGTDFQLEKAIESSINEYIMILDSSYSLKARNNKHLKEEDIYIYNFHSLKVEEFKNRLSYLINSRQKLDVYKESVKKPLNIGDILLKLKITYDIDVYACFLPSPLNELNVRVVKVFSPDGYPHIWTEIFDPEEILISKKLPFSTFPNKFKPIPFA
ncbi:YcaO-like family protein [Priestia flexa]|uniref:YcaO-like family protein n=1 Tax=Priestia flexa TaxID=86664 RepID=UPI001EF508C4|nr:YcaO-like family protein [Priestia flexa]MCG7315586.1 YcaO-like family protein [Priestia flexa]